MSNISNDIKEKLFRKGIQVNTQNISLRIFYDTEHIAHTQFLFTSIKKIKNKPIRNTLKRRMREIIRTMYHDIRPHYYVAIIVRQSEVSFMQLKQEITRALSHRNMLYSCIA